MAKRKLYWDTSCFISLISGDEDSEWQRAVICQDVLKHAKDETVELWTSVWSIAENVRPKDKAKTFSLPPWAALLSQADTTGVIPFPNAALEFENIWRFWKRNTMPSRHLTDDQANRIKGMFAWPWIRKIQVFQMLPLGLLKSLVLTTSSLRMLYT